MKKSKKQETGKEELHQFVLIFLFIIFLFGGYFVLSKKIDWLLVVLILPITALLYFKTTDNPSEIFQNKLLQKDIKPLASITLIVIFAVALIIGLLSINKTQIKDIIFISFRGVGFTITALILVWIIYTANKDNR